ncbi:hypothetical protein BGY98DRAFT_244155 [Russula aff. rugulosa BPL654]|nr:hypothetical protein BGY98DRAFT_244155 [Russula aff. rugulosa BPL654]
MTQRDSGPIELTRLRSARAVISHLDRRERCRQFDIAAAIHEASADMPHLGDVDDDDSLFEDPGHEPEGCTSHPVTATAGLLQSLRTVAPVSGTKRRWGDYFELSGALQCGFYPDAPLGTRGLPMWQAGPNLEHVLPLIHCQAPQASYCKRPPLKLFNPPRSTFTRCYGFWRKLVSARRRTRCGSRDEWHQGNIFGDRFRVVVMRCTQPP